MNELFKKKPTVKGAMPRLVCARMKQAMRSVAEQGYKLAFGVAEQVRASQRDIGRGVRGVLALLGHRQVSVQEAACPLAQKHKLLACAGGALKGAERGSCISVTGAFPAAALLGELAPVSSSASCSSSKRSNSALLVAP